jgi:hypothetical protein
MQNRDGLAGIGEQVQFPPPPKYFVSHVLHASLHATLEIHTNLGHLAIRKKSLFHREFGFLGHPHLMVIEELQPL